MEKVAFGGGCHWCTEAVFASLEGVHRVEQGWISADHPDATTFSEAVIVYYDSARIPLAVLTEIHLYTHRATSDHAMRRKYRSAIYTFDAAQLAAAEAILREKRQLFDKPLITKVYPFRAFKPNDEKYLRYYEKNRDKPFCTTYIRPKLALLLKRYGSYTKPERM